MDKISAIEKVKLLMRLAASSSSENEADNARVFANKFIEKFALIPDEYEEKEEKPIYTDDELLFQTTDSSEWQSILAFVVGNKYDCSIIQEENTASTGDKLYKYFVYGNTTDVVCSKMLFAFVKDEIDKAITKNCNGRGELYISSFCEGLVNGVRINIETEDFNIEGLTLTKEKEEINKEALVKTEEPKKDKDIPIKEKVQINKKEKPLNILAYFTGEGVGRTIHIGKIINDLRLSENSKSDEEELVQDYSWVSNIKDLFK